jgi:uncharacterized membrane protein
MVYIARLFILIAIFNIFVFFLYNGKEQLIKWAALGFVLLGIAGAYLLYILSERKTKDKELVVT